MAAYREPIAIMMRAKSPTIAQQPHSSWHSPVPYLYGGLVSMLGLIAFAMLIRLAYSFWKLSEFREENEEAKQDLEAQKAPPQAHEEKILVVMAGQDRPTFLATPVRPSKSSSLSNNFISSTCTYNKADKLVEIAEAVKDESDPEPLVISI